MICEFESLTFKVVGFVVDLLGSLDGVKVLEIFVITGVVEADFSSNFFLIRLTYFLVFQYYPLYEEKPNY
jgi:hypothetical protein